MSAGVNITLPASGYRNLHLSAASVIVSSLVSRRRRQLEPPESLAASRIASHSPSHASSPFTPGSRASQFTFCASREKVRAPSERQITNV